VIRWLAALALLLAAIAPAAAHDPLFIEATVSADGDTVSVVLETKQSLILAGVNEVRSQFTDRADYDRLEQRIGLWALTGVHLLLDGEELTLGYSGPPDGPLTDPLPLRLSATVPAAKRAAPHHLALSLTLMERMKGSFNVIDNVHIEGDEPKTVTVNCGERIELQLGTGVAKPQEEHVGTFADFLRLGFLHIVPEGLDHILFVLGLFLLSPRLKPLLTQVTAFTIAHSLTLGLSLAGVFTLPSRVVEPLIAASIAVVAIENIVHRELKSWRWMVVFAFGLVHGLGFAGALRQMRMPAGGIIQPLIGFNLGVEGGQLTVIAAAAALTWWCWKKPWYRKAVVIPSSSLIAAVGLFWAVQRGLGFGIEP
jgi:hydrogenase/urease accessory protein HupE